MTAATAQEWLAKWCVLRTARGRHHCDCHIGEIHGRTPDGDGLYCEHVVERGEQYVESLDSTPAYQSGSHYCLTCARHNGSLVERQPYRHALGCTAPFLEQLHADGRDCSKGCGGVPNDDYAPVPA